LIVGLVEAAEVLSTPAASKVKLIPCWRYFQRRNDCALSQLRTKELLYPVRCILLSHQLVCGDLLSNYLIQKLFSIGGKYVADSKTKFIVRNNPWRYRRNSYEPDVQT
jgi:hypothetical protein